MSVLAVMATRNEAGYIDQSLRWFIDDGIEVILIDNGSIDGTREIAERYLGEGLLRIEDEPWTGVYALERILRRKDEIVASVQHDWILHVDADEWLRCRVDATLPEFLERIVSPRSLVVDFIEYVFLPPVGIDMHGEDVRSMATTYYCFMPSTHRLMRAWRRGTMGSLADGAGHRFAGAREDVIHPESQVLRHYIGLSWSHAILKRAGRVYPEHELDRGWHGNRLSMRAARVVREHPALRIASPWCTRDLDPTMPTRHHFWEPGFWDATVAQATRPEG
jgi:glycosyltransferase involved in cell wall biosynthesis